MSAVREVNIADAIAYTRDRRQLAEAEGRVSQLPAAHMADCIASGLSGHALAQALTRHFPTAGRSDVYLAIGLAVAIMQADLTIGQMELATCRAGRDCQ
jgi:hypothetical protein